MNLFSPQINTKLIGMKIMSLRNGDDLVNTRPAVSLFTEFET